MRHLAICCGLAMVLLLAGMPPSARAEVCALYGDGTSDCWFKSISQCRESVRSRGGSCIERGTQSAPSPKKPVKSAR
jgi:hypothetical protein